MLYRGFKYNRRNEVIKSELNSIVVNTHTLVKTKIHKNSHKIRGSLYVIEDISRGIIKIGMSTKPQSRVKGQISLFNLGKNCRYYIGEYIENLLVVEKSLHNTLSKYKSYCEWIIFPYNPKCDNYSDL